VWKIFKEKQSLNGINRLALTMETGYVYYEYGIKSIHFSEIKKK
jgi:hypothetical protein